MAVVHVAEARRAPIVWARAHVGVVALALAQDAVAPLGALIVDVVSSIFLTFTAIEPPLSLSSSAIECILVAALLGYASNGGVTAPRGRCSK
jgi:hypothetical protein